MRGGYQTVDFHEIHLGADAVKVPGVYEAIEGNYYKAMLFTNMFLDNKRQNDLFVTVYSSAGNFRITLYGGTMVVMPGDMVTFTK